MSAWGTTPCSKPARQRQGSDRLRPVEIPLATEDLLENTGGVPRPQQRPLGTAACYLLLLLTCAILMPSSHSKAVAAVLDDPAKHLDDVVAGIEWAHAQGFYSIPVFLLSVDGGNTVAVDGARSPQEYAAVLADLIQSAGGGNADAGAVTDATTHVDHGN